MFRPALRSFRLAQSSLAPARTIGGRRYLSTESPHSRSRSWKSSAARWGLAVAGIYYYNTSPIFAEQPTNNLLNPNVEALEAPEHPDLETLTSKRSTQREPGATVLHSAFEAASNENASVSSTEEPLTANATIESGSPAELEEEAESEGAFNPVTGEINWDCACLGGMAHGPCGPQFREAFSCFVFSTEEPKGMDCIEKFQGMRDCFQEHPDVYKDELEDDEELDAGLETEKQELVKEIQERKAQQQDAASTHRLLEEPSTSPPESAAAAPKSSASPTDTKPAASSGGKPQPEAKVETSPQVSHGEEHGDEGKSATIRKPQTPPVEEKAKADSDLIPKAAHDARDAVDPGKKETEK